MFKCEEGCHQCCTLPPLKKSFLLKYQHLVKETNIEVIQDKGYCYAITRDYICPFLQGGKCVVYDDRPKICRQYGLSKGMPCIYIDWLGQKRTPEEQQRIRDQWEQKRKLFQSFLK